MKSIIAILLLAVLPLKSFAINYSGCDQLLNDGLYAKYEYEGLDQPATKATKKHGSTIGSSKASTEHSTATLDPKYSIHNTTSMGQYTTSTGPCAALAINDIYRNRELYIAQNREEVVKEIAIGSGEHLKVLAALSLCDRDAYGLFAKHMQTQTSNFMKVKDGMSYGTIIDSEVSQDGGLSKACYAFGI